MIGDVLPLDIPDLLLHGMQDQDHTVTTLPREGITRGIICSLFIEGARGCYNECTSNNQSGIYHTLSLVLSSIFCFIAHIF